MACCFADGDAEHYHWVDSRLGTLVSGETAPILFTCAAYFLPQLPTGILDQCMALPYHLYVISTSGTDMEAQLPLAYGTALVLIMIILLVNLLANALRKYF